MADLTGKTIANTYKDLLQSGRNGQGLPADTPVPIQDGQGNPSGLYLSLNQIDLTGTVKIKGTELTANVSSLNAVADFTGVSGFATGNGAGVIVGRTFSASTGISISNADGISGPPTFSLAATSVSAGTYSGQTTLFDVDETGRITGTNTTDTVSVSNIFAVNIQGTTGQFSGDVSIGGSLNFTGALAVASLSVTGDIHGNNVNVSTVFADGLQVTNAVCATSFHGSGAALTSITASSATNASYAASAGEAALAVSAHHASSATFAASANNATFAVSATNASFAISATNATNATSAVFASSATNATNAINVDYGGVVETSSANLGTVSASDMFVSGPVSVGGTVDVSGAVSIGGGLFVVGDVSAGNIYAGGILYGNGAGLFNVPSESGGTVNFVKAGTGIHVTEDGTTTTNPITASGTLALNADQSFGTVSATSFVIGGDNVAMSATVASLSATMATSIDNSNTNITTNTNAITSINSVIAGVSSALATSINNTNSNVTALSATLATSIANHLPLAGGTMTGNLILNGSPSANLQAATKQYVDNLTNAAIHFHTAVRVESPDTAGNLNATYDNGTSGVGATLTNAGTQAALVIDGVTLNISDRVLIYNQTNAYENGVYTVTDTGSASTNWVLTRATDADSYEPTTADGLDGGSYFYVQEGTEGAGEAYVCSNVGEITFGTTDITFVQFSSALVYTAGSGININTSRVISTSGVPTDADLTALSATMATSINNTNTNVTALSATMATSIATQASAITSINSKIATVSSTLATSIGNSNSAITALSATMATSINNTNTNLTALSATFASSISNYMPLSGGTFTGNVTYGDNVKAVFGAGSDLQIYHDGTNSIIHDFGTGFLSIKATDLYLGDSGGNTYISAIDNGVGGTVSLYHNTAKKLQTTSTGIDVTGELQADSLDIDGAADISGALTGPSQMTITGAGTLRDVTGDYGSIEVDGAGTNGYEGYSIGGRVLFMHNNDTNAGLYDDVNNQWILKSVLNNAVDLRHAGNIKLVTNTGGVTVTGTVVADGLSLGDNEYAYFGASNDLKIGHTGSASVIQETGTGDLYLDATNFQIRNGAGTETLATLTTNGAVTLYYDNSAKLATNSTGIQVTGDINPVNNIQLANAIYHSGDTDTFMEFHNNNQWRVVTGGTEMLEVNDSYILAGANTVGKVETASKTGSVTPDFYTYNSFVWTLTGNITLNNPSTEVTGMSGVFIFYHSGAGRTVSLGTDYETVGGAGLTLSSAAGGKDIVPYYVQTNGSILLGTPQLAFA